MDKPWKVVFAFVAVFTAGAVAGGMFGARRVAKRFRAEPAPVVLAPVPAPQAVPAAVVTAEKPGVAATPKESRPLPPMIPGPQLRQWAQRFNLTAEQQRAIRPIIARANEEYAKLRTETTKVTEGMYADISAILDDEQRADLEEAKKKLQERFEQERRRRIQALAAEAAAKKAANRPRSE